MYKKAGIITGVCIIIVGVLISVIANKYVSNKDKNENQDNSVIQNSQVVSGDKIKDTTDDTKNKDMDKENLSNNGSNFDSNGTRVLEISESQILTEGRTTSDIMVITGKKVQLVDTEINSVDKQLFYVLELLSKSSDNKLNLYVNGDVYNDVEIGDKLEVGYRVQVNDMGVNFKLIQSVRLLEN